MIVIKQASSTISKAFASESEDLGMRIPLEYFFCQRTGVEIAGRLTA